MRCNNCGWENKAEAVRCEKCQSVLSGLGVSPKGVAREHNTMQDNFQPGKTIHENSVFGEGPNGNLANDRCCPSCGYPVMEGAGNCPQCNSPVGTPEPRKQIPNNPARHSYQGTVNPYGQHAGKASCSLQMIPDKEEKDKQSSVLSFSGDKIILNRANTEPDNFTITSKEQAHLTFENGKWCLQDRSVQKTTFIHAKDKIELNPGDIILLGDRRFEFKG